MSALDTVKQMIEAFNRHDADAVAAFFSDNAVAPDPAYPEPLRGKEAIRKDMADFFVTFPDIETRATESVASGDTVATEWQMTGTHKGPLNTPDGPVEATGRPVRINVATFARLNEQGLITEHRRYYDLAGLIQQLGL